MTLRDRVKAKRESDAVAAKAAEARKHILLKLKADRNVREAYLQGLVFAAFANDEVGRVVDQERDLLRRIGEAAAFNGEEVDAVISRIDALTDVEKMDLIADCVGVFDSSELMAAFVTDFTNVWTAGGGTSEALGEYLRDFESWAVPVVADGLKEKRLKAEKEAKKAKEEADRLAAQKKAEFERVRADSFYLIACGLIEQEDVTLSKLKEIKKELKKNEFGSLKTSTLWMAIYNEYVKRLKGEDVKKQSLNLKPYASAAAGLALITGIAGFPAAMVGTGMATGIACKSAKAAAEAAAREARLGLVKALACLCALKCTLADNDVLLINDLLRKAGNASLPQSPDGTDGFWFYEVEPRLCARLNVGRVILAG